jgi:hypothetical protein
MRELDILQENLILTWLEDSVFLLKLSNIELTTLQSVLVHRQYDGLQKLRLTAIRNIWMDQS